MIEIQTDRDVEETLRHILEAMETEFQDESDRVVAIVGAAYLDEMLEELFRAVCVESPKEIDRLLRPDGVLGSNGARINIAYSLGLITHDQLQDLKIVAKIRNQFAHRFTSMGFDSDQMRDLCGNLRQPGIHAALPYKFAPKEQAAIMEKFALEDCKEPREKFRVTVTHLLSGLARRTKYARKGSHQLWFSYDPDSAMGPDMAAANN